MLRKLMYILFILLMAANLAAQENYVIDSVCVGASRTYRIEGGNGSTYEWHLQDTSGNELTVSNSSGVLFKEVDSNGDSIWGSDIEIQWNDVGEFILSTFQYSVHGCDTLEYGYVKVFDLPVANAGDDIIACNGQPVTLLSDTAWNYSSILWTAPLGDGAFDDEYQLHPTYTPGYQDSINGRVELILTAEGMSLNGTCTPVTDTMVIQINNPQLDLAFTNLLCYHDSSGTIKANVSGGMEPYSYAWSGPDGYNAAQDSVFHLAAGMYFVVVTDANGCTATDSVEITEPDELLAEITPGINETCPADTIHLTASPVGGTGDYTHLWTGNGAVFLDATNTVNPIFRDAPAGSYELIYTVTDENGCEAADTVNVIVLPSTASTIDTLVCAGELPFVWNDSTYNAFGTYTNVIDNSQGCDSVITLNIIELPATTSSYDTLVCAGELPFVWNDSTYNAFGTYTNVIDNSQGCDSVVTLNIIELPATTSSYDTLVCAGELPFVWNDSTYNAFGTYTNVIDNSQGCDSVVTLNIIELPATTSSYDTLVCAGELPFVWNDSTYNAFGTYTNVIDNSQGCDSVVTLNIIELPATTSSYDTLVCAGELPFVWNDSTYNAFGTYTNVIDNSQGCDSVVTLNIIELPATTSSYDTLVCAGELPFVWNDSTYNAFGTYTNVIDNSQGCDSVVTLNIIELPATTSSYDTLVCAGELPFVWNDSTYNAFGTYTNVIDNSQGCDSVITLNIIELPATTSSYDTLVCAGELPFVWNDSTYNAFGTYTNVIDNSQGCDSVVTLNIIELPATTSSYDTLVCAGELPFVWNDSTYNAFGTYTNVIDNSQGCDSVVTLNIIELPATTSSYDTLVCAGELPFVWNDSTYNAFGTYTNVIDNSQGCDSVVTLNIIELPATTSSYDTLVCAGELPFVWNDSTYNAFGTYTNVIDNSQGCDSVVTLNIIELPATTSSYDTLVCAGELPFVWNDSTYNAFGTYTNVIDNSQGCDSVVTLNIIELPATTSSYDTLVCAGELPFVWNDSTYNAFGTYTNVIDNSQGCDSVVTLNIIELPATTSSYDTLVCAGELPFVWNDSTYNAFGTYTNVIDNSQGCDSVVTLNIIELPATTSSYDTLVCAGELPFVWNDSTYNAFGTYTNVIDNSQGCDSVVTLNIIELPATTSSYDTLVCAGELPFVWNDSTYNAFGTYTNVIDNSQGCDSVVTLNIIELPATTSSYDTLVCAGELPFVWNDSTYNAFGTYTNVIDNSQGCDSVVTLNIIELPATTSSYDTLVCAGELPFVWNDSTYNAFGTYTNVIDNSQGCDSVVTLNIIELPATTSSYDTLVCAGELPFVWNDSTYNAFGTYTNVIDNSQECDSVVTLNIIELPATYSAYDTTVCENQIPFTWNGIDITAAGDYPVTLPSAAGCDSTVTLTVNVVDNILASVDTTVCENQVPFTWNGIDITAAGDYPVTLPSAAGCDSTVTLTVNVVDNILASADTTVCENQIPFTWNGQNIDAAGDYTASLTSAAGCDSTVTLTVNVVNNILASADTTVCENQIPFTWNGIDITAAGDYPVTLPSAAGCDSTVTLTVNMVDNILASVDTTVCENQIPFTWNGQNIDAAGDYTASLTSAAGCDSTVTLTVNVVDNILASADTTVCENQIPFTWNGIDITAAGDYPVTLPSAAGCDSTVTLTVNMVDNILASVDTTVCENQIPFTWNGQNIDAAGDYSASLTSAAGCDSTVTLTVNVVDNILASVDTTVCENQIPFTWNGQNIDAAGDYTASLTSAAGCDSTVTLTVNVVDNILASADTTVCENQVPFTWNGQNIDAAGDYTASLTSAAGCDSTVTLTVNVVDNILASADTTVCENQIPFTWNGQNIDAAGDYTASLTSAAGCDSTVTLTVNVVDNILASVDTTVCENQIPFTWNGQNIDAAGDYTASLTSAAGCDSTVTLTVNVVDNILASVDTTVCENQIPFTWNGQNIDAAGDYTASLTSAAGCDSTVTLTVNVVDNILASVDTTVCENQVPFTWNSIDITAAGDYPVTLPSAAGCDSTVTLTVNVVDNILASVDTTVCENQIPFTWNGQNIDAAGDYTASLTSAAGCDSTVTLTVNVVDNILASVDTTVCENQVPFTWNGQNIDAAGDYTASLTSAAGCDSTVTLTVNVVDNILASVDTTVCENQVPFTWNGQNIDAAGDYTASLTSAAGCDSTVTLTVNVVDNILASVDTTVCENQIPFTWNGQNIDAAGDYTASLTSAAGCDSTVTLTVNVVDNILASADTTVCENQIPFTWNGQNIDAAGDYTASLTSAAGCDSTVTLTVNVVDNILASADTTVCENQIPFTWNGQNIDAAGDYTASLTSAAGCDSTVTLTVNVVDNILASVDTTVCENQIPFTWNGQNIDAAGDYSASLTSAAGCDSTVTLTVSVVDNILASVDTTVCENQIPFTWNGQNIDAAGDYTASLTSAAGCDSTVTLTVNVVDNILASVDTTVCENQVPFTWNGQNIDAAGDYTASLTSAAGCDSTVTLTVNVVDNILASADTTVCENQIPFTWNGQNIDAAGDYTASLTSAAGCDSTVTLTVNVVDNILASVDTTVCENQIPFTWNGQNIDAAGDYTASLTSAAGCDSTVTLTVNVVDNILASADTTVCENQIPFTWNGQNIDAAGDYTASLTSAAGCDSTVTLTVNVVDNILASVDTTVCENQIPFIWNSIDITAAGDYPVTLPSAAGCDSTVTLTVNVVDNILASVDTTVCENQIPFTWNGQNIDAAGDYTASLTSAAGCDSTVTLTVNVVDNILASVDTTVCENQVPFIWNGIDITAAGDYPFTLPSAAGCDSTVTLTVNVVDNILASVDTTVCENQVPFTWNGIDITAAGDYPFTLPSAAGCDSTVTLTVNVVDNILASVDTTVCENQVPFIWNGIDITAAGDYPFTLPSAAGCDSTVTLTVNVVDNILASVDTTVCENQIPFIWNGIDITAAGDYPFTLPSAAGCDSTVTLTVNVVNNILASVDTTVCENQIPFIWNGIDITAAGDYPFTLPSAAGCDSTVTLTVNVVDNILASVDTTVCENQVPFTWNGIDITAAGDYPFTLPSAAGCDSTVTLTVNVVDNILASVDTTVCENQVPFIWNGIDITAAGDYPFTLPSAAGCDSTVTLTVNVVDNILASVDTTVCENQVPFIWNGIDITAAGDYPFTLPSAAGCDSTVTLTVNVVDNILASVDTTVCENQVPFIWNGIDITAAGDYPFTLPSAAGCDSTVTLTVNVVDNILASVDTTVCENQVPFIWNGIDINAAGDYPFTLPSAAGCDSTVTLTVNVVDNILASVDTTVCENQVPFIWNGIDITAAGDYPFTLPSAAGCDSTVTLTVNVVDNILASVDTTVCENQVPFIWNGIDITAAGDYPFTLPSAAGCDSTVTLTVNVVDNILASVDTTVCENQVPFIWNGIDITAAGDYPFTLPSAAGCDSTVTLTVNVVDNILASVDTTVCENQIPFIWNGIDITAAGDYPFTLPSAAGCDSTVTLTVNVVNNILASVDTTVCENQIPFIWNGIDITAAGDYPFTLPSAAGCDSTVTLTVNVVDNILASVDTTVCENQVPFTWNGRTLILRRRRLSV